MPTRLHAGARRVAPAMQVVLAILLALPSAAEARRNVYTAGEAGSTNNVFAYDINASAPALSQVAGSPFNAAAGAGGVAINPAGTRVYVRNFNDNSLSAYNINASNGALQSTVPGSPFSTGVGTNPAGIAINPAGTRLYVTYFGTGKVAGYNIAADGSLTANGPAVAARTNAGGVAINPAGTRLYVANFGDASVSAYVINADGTIGSQLAGSPFGAGGIPGSIAINPAGTRLYVANNFDGTISAYTINASDPQLTPISGSPFGAGAGTGGLAINLVGTRLYGTNAGDGNVSAYTINANGSLTPPIDTDATGATPTSSIMNPAGTRLYVTNLGEATVLAYSIDPSDGKLTQIGSSIPAATTQDFQSIGITPNQGPTANFTSAPAAAGSESVFNASSSSDDGGIVKYSWNFGDSTSTTTSLASVAHTYSTAGTYTVSVTETDDEGCSTSQVWASWTASCNGTSAATKSNAVTIAAAPSGGAGSITIGAIKAGENALTATLTCSGGPCTGKVSVVTKRKYSFGKKRKHKRRPKKKQLGLGSKTFSLNADQKTNARIVYSKKNLKQLKKLVLKGPFKKKGRKVPVLIKVESGGKTMTRTEAIKFKGQKKSKRRK